MALNCFDPFCDFSFICLLVGKLGLEDNFLECVRLILVLGDVCVGSAQYLSHQAVAHAKGGCGELVADGRIDAAVVAAEVVWTDQRFDFHVARGGRHELVVDDVLDLCYVDATRLVVERIVRPRRIDGGQLLGDAIMLAIEQRLHAHQSEVLRSAILASVEALNSARQAARVVGERQIGSAGRRQTRTRLESTLLKL